MLFIQMILHIILISIVINNSSCIKYIIALSFACYYINRCNVEILILILIIEHKLL